jgi:hypothetical protein
MHSRRLSPRPTSRSAHNADEIGKIVNSLAAKGVKSWGKPIDVADPAALDDVDHRRKGRPCAITLNWTCLYRKP